MPYRPSSPSDRWLDVSMTVYQWITPALAAGVAAAATWDQSDFSLVAFIVITLVLWLALFLALLIPYFFVVFVIDVIIQCVDYWRRRRRGQTGSRAFHPFYRASCMERRDADPETVQGGATPVPDGGNPGRPGAVRPGSEPEPP